MLIVNGSGIVSLVTKALPQRHLMPDTGTTSGLPDTPKPEDPLNMAHTRVLHEQRGFRMSKNYAEQVMREHCTITWAVPGLTVRDTTDDERIELRAEQARQERLRAPLEWAEIPGLVFKGPLPVRNDLILAAHQFVSSH